MAETVKKSRIVSEDNLEESLMEEFNMRLKHCMSEEKIQEDQATEKEEKDIYEEIATNHYDVPKSQTETIYEEVKIIEAIPRNGLENGHKDQIYENVQEMRPILIIPPDTIEEIQLEDGKTAKDRMLLSTDDTSCLLFTQTVTSPMLTPSEENIDFLKGFANQSNNTSDESSSKNEELDLSEKLEDLEAEAIEPIYENIDEIENKPIFTHGRVDLKADCATFINNEISCEETSRSEDYDFSSEDVKLESSIPDVCQVGPSLIPKDIQEEPLGPHEEVVETLPEDLPEEEPLKPEEDPLKPEEGHLKPGEEPLKPEEDHGGSIEEQEEHLEPLEEPAKVEMEDDVKSESTETETIESKSDTQEFEVVESGEVSPREAKVADEEEVEGKLIDNPSRLVDALKTKYLSNAKTELPRSVSMDKSELMELKTVDIMKQISKFENKSPNVEENDEDYLDDSTEMSTETFVETTTTIETSSSAIQDKSLKKKKSKKSRSHDKENISVPDTNTNTKVQEENFYNVNVKSLCRSFGDLTKICDDLPAKEKLGRDRDKFANTNKHAGGEIPKSSFNKFDALQKKNVLHVRSSDSSKAQEKFNGSSSQVDNTNCKACGKVVFQMEQIKAERSVYHKNCFRCQECSKQLTVDTYQSNEGTVYCKPHFKSLFAPKAVEDEAPPTPRRHEMIIRENQPLELPPDVVRASDKPDLGLEELQSLNVKERFQVFENFKQETSTEKSQETVNVKRSPSILSKLAKFQAKGMDVGVPVDALNGIPIEESSSEEEEEPEEEEVDGEDADLIRAKKVQKEKPFHFTGMSDVKSKWEHGEQNSKDERREERKQEIQSIRNRLFMGKQGKMKEAYQQAVQESESGSNIKRPTTPPPTEVMDTRSIMQKFEKGEVYSEEKANNKEAEDMSVFESGISKKSRSIFLELDANATKAPPMSPVSPPKQSEVKKVREAYMMRQSSEDTVKSSEHVDDVKIQTADIQQRFKFFETYKEPEKERRQFRITPPRDGQVKVESPDREVYHDPDVVRSEEHVEDSVIAKETHTATKVLSKFRQMEENLHREPLPLGPKPLKRFTPPPEPARHESGSENEGSESEEESEEIEETDHTKLQDADLVEAQKAARARQLRAKFEKWEAKEIVKEQQQVNIIEESNGDQQSQIESTKVLRAKFESLRDGQNEVNRQPKVKVNRFVDTTSALETCEGCKERIYPLEKVTVHNQNYHKKCFKCMECGTILRMDSYTYNQGRLYCIPHFKRLFISKGNYDTAFGLEQHKEKWNATVA